MNDWILGSESMIRLGTAFGVFSLMAIWEAAAVRRELTAVKARRWFGNLGLVVIDTLVVSLLFPTAAIGMALMAEHLGWGLFHLADVPYWAAVLVSVILLDFAIYLQHLMFHAIPVLWRLHVVHHADVDFDVTTGVRFHPVEILLSMLIKLAAISLLGPPILAVLLFEVLLNALAMFNHANVRIPLKLDRVLRWFIVTPDMHRVHHSVDEVEYGTNFGFNLSCWDRILGTYLDQPEKGHQGMIIGLADFREARWQTIPRMLAIPFVRQAATGARCGAGKTRGE